MWLGSVHFVGRILTGITGNLWTILTCVVLSSQSYAFLICHHLYIPFVVLRIENPVFAPERFGGTLDGRLRMTAIQCPGQ
jgi:hypothetical protein